MKTADKKDFLMAIKAFSDAHNRPLGDAALAMYWNALQVYEWPAVRQAMSDYATGPDCKFFPQPGQIISLINSRDGRPSADEFWPEMPISEDQTVVWTDEASAAFFECLPLVQRGDLIAARMSFKAAYDHKCEAARRMKTPVRWTVSNGHDERGREIALRSAIEHGRLKQSYAQMLLPHIDFSDCTAVAVSQTA